MVVKVGKPAPDFTADAYVKGEPKPKKVSLADQKGKYVVLFFYTRDFSSVCPTEMKAFAQKHKEFEKEHAVLLAASTDSYLVHKNWLERDLPDVAFPVLADTNHEMSRDYGVLIEEEGKDLRGTFIIDPDGKVLHAEVNLPTVSRSIDETLRLLQAFRTGKLCQAGWKPGDKTID